MISEVQILNTIPSGVVVLDREDRIRYANNWISGLTGYSLRNLYGEPISKLLKNFPTIHPLKADDPLFHRDLVLTTDTNNEIEVCVFVKKGAFGTDPLSTYVCINAIPFKQGKEENPTAQRDRFHGLIGKSPSMQEIYGFIEMAGATDANVVIQGESGTGKELIAAAIHTESSRAGKQFVRVNCAALTESLLESELFGHAKGAFTGAYRDHIGKFEFADKGTIFLDEIGEISPAMQAKLLRVIQERTIVRVGDNREINVDVRVIVATNRNLRALVTKGKFREDLFYRLNVFPIHVPPLRERGIDIPLLIDHFINTFCLSTNKHITACSPDCLRIIIAYCWPGNVRELQNAIEHAFVLCRQQEIQLIDLPHDLRVAAVREGICAQRVAGITAEQTLYPSPLRAKQTNGRTMLTREVIHAQLAASQGNKAATARTLGISSVGLWKRMKKLGMM